MNDRFFGMYEAIVTDTSTFKATGKIKTRISVFNNYNCPDNLLDNYSSEIFKRTVGRDTLTAIMMPFGGGDNYGMFKLPQINSKGVVIFINGDVSQPVWIGSISSFIYNNKTLIKDTYPTDNLETDESAISEANVYNFNDDNSFVIRLKETSLNDFSNSETMDWNKSRTENILVMNKSEFRIRHYLFEDENQKIDSAPYSEILFETDKKSAVIKRWNTEDNIKEVAVNTENITIRNKLDDTVTTINMLDDGDLRILSKQENEEATVTLKPTSVELKTGSSHLKLIHTMGNDEIMIKAPKIAIHAEQLSLGETGYNLVVTPMENIATTLEDGTMLTTANNIKV